MLQETSRYLVGRSYSVSTCKWNSSVCGNQRETVQSNLRSKGWNGWSSMGKPDRTRRQRPYTKNASLRTG